MRGVPPRLSALAALLRRHRAVTRLSVVALSLVVVVAASETPASQAGPEAAYVPPPSILIENVGVGLRTTQPVTLEFDSPMDPDAVASGLVVVPETEVVLGWAPDHRTLNVFPARRWQTDTRYVVIVPAPGDDSTTGMPLRVSFTTQTAPTVVGFGINLVVPPIEPDAERLVSMEPDASLDRSTRPGSVAVEPSSAVADGVSATSQVVIAFSAPMRRSDVEAAFAITPHVEGTFAWEGEALLFTPLERLDPDARYTVSVAMAQDLMGNRLSGTTSFSFTTAPGAQVVKVRPKAGERDVEDGPLELWFSQAMDPRAVEAAFALVDLASGEIVDGEITWNDEGTQLTFEPATALSDGATFEVRLGEGARDADGNAVEAAYRFATTAPPAPAPAPVVAATTTAQSAAPAAATQPAAASTPAPAASQPAPAPAPPPSGDLAAYALQQVNSARAAYGFAPLVLDAKISAVASAHAWDQLRNGYFSHYGRDGSTVHQRLARGGVSFSAASENQCQNSGSTALATLQWCHSYFMAEPYPGHWNHIGNILNPRFTRMGVGIAQSGGKVMITWNFAG